MIDFFIKGGLLMGPILFCSVAVIAVTIHKTIQYYPVRKTVSLLSQDFSEIKNKRFDPLIKAVQNGADEKEISIIGTKLIRELEKGLEILSLVSVISPLLGLTGTVTGMIKAFQIIANQGSQINPSLLAGGIWEALLTTAAGLLVAIPAHIAFHLLEKQLSDIELGIKEFLILKSIPGTKTENKNNLGKVRFDRSVPPFAPNDDPQGLPRQ